jgi:hypothetical protein
MHCAGVCEQALGCGHLAAGWVRTLLSQPPAPGDSCGAAPRCTAARPGNPQPCVERLGLPDPAVGGYTSSKRRTLNAGEGGTTVHLFLC